MNNRYKTNLHYLSLLLFLIIAAMTFPVLAETPKVTFIVKQFEVLGENQLSQRQIHAILSPYVGSHEGLKTLNAAAKALQTAHADKGFAFHRVVLPPQTMEKGIVQLKVVAFTLGEISVTGSQFFTAEQVQNSLPELELNKDVNTKEVARALSLANRHPAREHIVNIKKGRLPDTIDAEVKVKDARPYLGFVGVNNTGSTDTGRVRISGGGQHSNLLGFDDVFTASYTTSQLHPEDVMQYGLSYSIPLYDFASNLSVFYSRSDVDSGTINSIDISGAGQFVGFNLNHILLSHGQYTHEISFGIVDKLFENEAVFSGTNLTSDVRSRPITLSYNGQYKTAKLNAGFSGSLNINTRTGNNNADAEYEANRTEAKNDWHKFTISAFANYFLTNDWLLRGILESQFSNEALIAGEQFGLGGIRSVRGFEERAITGDSGIRMSAELWTPPIKRLYDLRLLTFIDYGYMDREAVQAGEEGSDSVISVGLGARWSWRKNLNLTIDYGHVINEAEHLKGTLSDSGNAKVHVNLLARF